MLIYCMSIQINLCPNMQFLSTQQSAYPSFLSYFWVWFRLHPCVTLLNLRQTCYMNINYSYPTTMYESISVQMCVILVKYYLPYLLKK